VRREALTTISFQRDLIDRLYAQLRALQSRHGVDAVPDVGHGGPSPPWFHDPSVMSPLLTAYDARTAVSDGGRLHVCARASHLPALALQELESSNKRLTEALASSRSSVEEAERENAVLRADLRAAMDRLASAGNPSGGLTGMGGSHGVAAGPLHTQQLEAYGELARLAQEEATALRAEVAAIHRELEEARAAVTERDADALATMQRQRALMASLGDCQATLRAIDTARVAAEAEVQRLAGSLAISERARAQAAAELEAAQSTVAAHGATLADYRTAIEELTRQANVRGLEEGGKGGRGGGSLWAAGQSPCALLPPARTACTLPSHPPRAPHPTPPPPPLQQRVLA
jgi:hypothetical protein